MDFCHHESHSFGMLLAAEWKRVRDVAYRNRLIWGMKWSNALTTFRGCLVEAAAHGGPIAILHFQSIGPSQPTAVLNPLEPVAASRHASSGYLETYTAGGTLISRTPWAYERLLAAAWSTDAMLVCVFETGAVRILSVFGEVKFCFNIDDVVKTEGGLLSAAIDVNAEVIVVLTRGMRLYANTSFTHRHCVRLADPPVSSIPIFMKVLVRSRPQSNNSQNNFSPPHDKDISVFIASETGSLFLATISAARRLPLSDGPFVSLQISPACEFIAIQSSGNSILIFSTESDFSTPLDTATVPVQHGQTAVQMAWVANDCIACHVVEQQSASSKTEQHTLFVGGPGNEWLTYQFGVEDVILLSEANGLRVIGCQSCSTIERVPQNTENIFSPKSEKPSALLYNAWQRYTARDIEANNILMEVLPDLAEALLDCIDAATRETDASIVVPLLRSVAFGRLYLRESCSLNIKHPENYQSGLDNSGCSGLAFDKRLSRLQRRIGRRYIAACRDMRIVSALHGLPLEMCLTVPQFRSLGAPRLLRILANRRMHLLALRIGEFLGLCYPPRPVRVYGPLDVDCSPELRDICSFLWDTVSCSSSAQFKDTTRPPGVSLALPLNHSSGSVVSEPSRVIPHPKTHSMAPSYTMPPSSPTSVNKPRDSLHAMGEAAMCYVLEHWAREKIASSGHLTDQQLLEILRSTLVQFAHIRPKIVNFVLEAVRLSRPHLATFLLQFEPRSRVQVRILLRLAEIDLAIKQAVCSGDVDLMFECLAAVESDSQHDNLSTSCNRFEKILDVLSRYPVLWDFYELLCVRTGKLEWLQQLYEEAGHLERAAWISLYRGLSLKNPSEDESQERYLAHSAAFFGSSSRNAASRELRVVQQLTLEHVELLNLQKQWEMLATEAGWARLPCKLRGLTLSDTFKQLHIRYVLQTGGPSTATQPVCSPSQSWFLRYQIGIYFILCSSFFSPLLNFEHTAKTKSETRQTCISVLSNNTFHHHV